VVTRAPRRLVDGGGWKDQSVTLPEGSWRDELTGRLHAGGGDVLCADLFAQLPVALLVAR
jgi:(1->4)-alpha-D-glucan 1-alpha-D-glucosylmutase